MRRATVLLDSNVWRYFVEADAVNELRARSKAASIDIAACPAVANELLATGDPQLRRLMITAITRGTWVRLMPDAYSMAEEVRQEIARCRPGWLAEHHDLTEWHALRSAYVGGFWWQRLRRDPAGQAAAAAAVGGRQLASARLGAVARRRRALQVGPRFETAPLDGGLSELAIPHLALSGAYQTWRLHAFGVWSEALFKDSGSLALHDWLRPWLDMPSVYADFHSWRRFWLHDVEAERLPRHWIRSALQALQATRRTTGGTPVDNQISTYLVDCDAFMTSDSALVGCLAALAGNAPTRLAVPYALPGGAQAVPAALELLAEIAAGHNQRHS